MYVEMIPVERIALEELVDHLRDMEHLDGKEALRVTTTVSHRGETSLP